MSLRLEMLQVARLAPRVLKDSAELVRDFLLRQFNEGGFADRTGRSDLYYTVFGIDGLIALQAELPWKNSDRTCGASATESIWISSISVACARPSCCRVCRTKDPMARSFSGCPVSLSRWRL